MVAENLKMDCYEKKVRTVSYLPNFDGTNTTKEFPEQKKICMEKNSINEVGEDNH